LADLGSAVGSIILGFDSSGVDQATAALSGLQSKANALQSVGANIAGLGAAIGGPLVGAVKVAADFNQELANIASVGGKAAQDSMQQISDTALQLGKDTAFSASQAAQGMEELIKAGLPVADVLDGAAASALNLSAATGTAVPESATLMATALNVFSDSMAGFNTEGDKATHIADLFAQVANASASDVHGLGLGFEQSATVARMFGISVDDTAAALGVLANAGLKGSDAGTSFKQMLISLTNVTAPAAKALGSIGLTIDDFFGPDGTFIGVPATFDTFREAMQKSGATAEQVNSVLAKVFGTDAVRAASIFFNTTDQGWTDFKGNMDSAGTAAEQAQVRLNTFEGALETFRGSVETLAIQIGTIFLPVLVDIVHGLTNLVNSFISANPQIQQFVAIFGGIAAILLTATGGALLAAGHILRLVQVLDFAGVSVKALTLSIGLLGIAIGAGILAYQTNFLGFADAVNSAMTSIQQVVTKVIAVINRAFDTRQTRGVSAFAAAIGSVGRVIKQVTGINLTDQFNALGHAIDAATASFQNAINSGLNPIVAALLAVQSGLASIGGGHTPGAIADLARGFGTAARAVEEFGNVFGAVFTTDQARGINAFSSGLDAVGKAISAVTGVDVTGFFGRLAQSIQAGVDTFKQATNQGINPLEAAFIGLRQALSDLIGLDLRGLTDALGGIAGTARDVVAAISGGGFARAGQILGDAIQGISTGIGNALANIDFSGIAQQVGSALSGALSTIGTFLSSVNWSGVASTAGTFLTSAFGAIGSFLGTIASTVGGVLVKLLNGVWTFLSGLDFRGILQIISTTLLNLFNVGGDWLGPIAATVGSAIVTSLQNVADFLGGIDVGNVVSAVADALGAGFATVGNFLGPLAASVGSAVVAALGNVASFLGGIDVNAVIVAVGSALGSAFSSIGNFLGPIAASAGSAIITALGSVGDFLDGLDTHAILSAVGAALVDAFSGIGSVLGTVGALVGGALVTIINGVGAFLGGLDFSGAVSAVATAVGTAFTTIGNALPGIAQTVGTAIGTTVATAGNFLGALDFRGVVSVVSGFIGMTFSTVGNALPGLAETVGNAIGAAVSTAGNFLGTLDFSSAVSAVTDAITAAFGGGGPNPNEGEGGGAGFSGIAAALGGALASALNDIGAFLADFNAPAVVTDVVTRIQTAFDAGGVFDFSVLGADIKTALEQACGVDLSGVFDALGTAVSTAALAFNNFQILVTPALSSFIGFLSTISGAGITALFDAISTSVANAALAFNNFQILITPALQALANNLPDISVGGIFDTITGAVANAALAFNNFQLLVTPALTAFKDGMLNIPTPDFSLVTNAFSGFVTLIQNAIDKVGELKIAIGGLPTPDPSTVASIDASIASRKAGDMGQGQPAAAGTAPAPIVLPPIVFDAAAAALQIITDISNALGAGTSTLSAALGAVVSVAGQGVTSAAAIGTKLIADIAGSLGPSAGGLQAALNAVIQTTIAAGSATAASASAIGAALDTAMSTALGASASLVVQAAQGLVGVVVSAASAAAAAASTIGDAFDTAVGGGIGAGAGTAISAAQAMIASAIAAAQSASAGAFDAGFAIGEGLARGMQAALTDVQAAASQLAAAAESAVKQTAQIASPSKVSFDLGTQWGQGFIDGINKQVASVGLASQGMATSAAQALSTHTSTWADFVASQSHNERLSLRRAREAGQLTAQHRADLMGGGTIADFVNDTSRRTAPQPVHIHLQTQLDGQALDNRIIQTSIGGMTQVPHRGGHRNSRFSLAGA
jgi:TP901 family phage tail tape measure protein